MNSDLDIRTILERSQTIAVVGASDDSTKAACTIPALLVARGYHVLPVNPFRTTVLGIPSVPSLRDINEHVDIVNVFRPASEARALAEQAAAVGARTLWLQLGINSDEAEAISRSVGMEYIEDLCIGASIELLGITKHQYVRLQSDGWKEIPGTPQPAFVRRHDTDQTNRSSSTTKGKAPEFI